MESPYDIFRKLADGSPIWVCAVRSLEEAKSPLLELKSATPAGVRFGGQGRCGDSRRTSGVREEAALS
jgi:hypothetical protein